MNNNAVLDRQFLAAGQSRWTHSTGTCSSSGSWRARPSLHTQERELCVNQTASAREGVHIYSPKAGRQRLGDRAMQPWFCVKKAPLCSPFPPLCIRSRVQRMHKFQDQTQLWYKPVFPTFLSPLLHYRADQQTSARAAGHGEVCSARADQTAGRSPCRAVNVYTQAEPEIPSFKGKQRTQDQATLYITTSHPCSSDTLHNVQNIRLKCLYLNPREILQRLPFSIAEGYPLFISPPPKYSMQGQMSTCFILRPSKELLQLYCKSLYDSSPGRCFHHCYVGPKPFPDIK